MKARILFMRSPNCLYFHTKRGRPNLPLLLYLILFYILIVCSQSVHHGSIGLELDDSVGDGLDELVVVGCEEHVPFKAHQPFVDRCDGFQIQMVGRLIQHQHVGAVEHHAGQHAADLLSARQHLHLFVHVVAREEHPSQETSHKGLRGL